jgi:hypothetical protein
VTATGGTFTHPEYLVSTDWLAAHLGDADVRVFDCTTLALVGGRLGSSVLMLRLIREHGV